jgi:hypothetical protein
MHASAKNTGAHAFPIREHAVCFRREHVHSAAKALAFFSFSADKESTRGQKTSAADNSGFPAEGIGSVLRMEYRIGVVRAAFGSSRITPQRRRPEMRE